MAKGTMKLTDPSTGRMECRVCGAVHWANLKTGGGYYRSSWQCHDRDNHPPIEDAAFVVIDDASSVGPIDEARVL